MSILQQMGHETKVGTPIQRLRRPELYKIARAHGITYKDGCKKTKILPLIEEAVEEGRIDPTNVLKGAKYPHFITGERVEPKVTSNIEVVVGTPSSNEPCESIHLGNGKKWCVMQGNTIIHEGLVTKEEADGLHIS